MEKKETENKIEFNDIDHRSCRRYGTPKFQEKMLKVGNIRSLFVLRNLMDFIENSKIVEKSNLSSP